MSHSSEFAAVGFATSALSGLLLQPLERLKAVMVATGEHVRMGRLQERQGSGILTACRLIWKDGGLRSFWRGTMAMVTSKLVTSVTGFVIADYLSYSSLMSTSLLQSNHQLKSVLVGTTIGSVHLLLISPVEVIKTRLVSDVRLQPFLGKTPPFQYQGMSDTVRQTAHAAGPRGFFSGYGPAALGIFIYRSMYFGLHDLVRSTLPAWQGGDVMQPVQVFALGYGVTLTAGLLSHPFSVIHNRMAVAAVSPTRYRSSLECVVHILRREGPLALWRGASIAFIKTLGDAMLLMGFELARKESSAAQQDHSKREGKEAADERVRALQQAWLAGWLAGDEVALGKQRGSNPARTCGSGLRAPSLSTHMPGRGGVGGWRWRSWGGVPTDPPQLDRDLASCRPLCTVSNSWSKQARHEQHKLK
eukprot:CAMPEP_0177679242 /NCGR_PEP_ID=MMETSP0447-20121125/29491_1 /TAXON_ID=0 /ORGANISM="Stygamoeba regulata, Strain BSH-02190019" /LENGTH=416 /DNA_ID=CAMNT_0019188405 /DNA_START=40 /DNA_END=1288 /DNA_ORIENTATION=-